MRHLVLPRDALQGRYLATARRMDYRAQTISPIVHAHDVVAFGPHFFNEIMPGVPPSVWSFSVIPARRLPRCLRRLPEKFAKTVQELESRPPSPEDKTRQKIVWFVGPCEASVRIDLDEEAIEPLRDDR